MYHYIFIFVIWFINLQSYYTIFDTKYSDFMQKYRNIFVRRGFMLMLVIERDRHVSQISLII